MLNKGLLLSKPFESRYAQYRQFLIANRGRYSNPSSIRFALLNAVRKKLPFDPAGVGSIDLLKFYREPSFVIFEKKYDVHSQSTKTRPIKSCPECSETGFHTPVFDADWLTICPIHKSDLTNKCHKCKMPWPSCSEILSRKCAGCGALVEPRELAEKNAFHDTCEFENLQHLSSLINVMQKPSVYSINYVDSAQPPSLANRLNNFFPTASLVSLDNPELSKFISQLKVPLYDYYQTSFSINKEGLDPNNSLTDLDLKRLRTTAMRHIEIFAETSRLCVNKRLGTCSNSDLDCPACRSWALLDRIDDSPSNRNDNNSKSSNQRFSWWEHHLLSSADSQLPIPRKPCVIDSIKIEASQDEKELGLAKIKIPKKVKKLLLHYEYRLSFTHGFLLFTHLLKCQKANMTSLIDIYSSAPPSLKYQGILSNPYYLFLGERDIQIVTQKPYDFLAFQ